MRKAKRIKQLEEALKVQGERMAEEREAGLWKVHNERERGKKFAEGVTRATRPAKLRAGVVCVRGFSDAPTWSQAHCTAVEVVGRCPRKSGKPYDFGPGDIVLLAGDRVAGAGMLVLETDILAVIGPKKGRK